MEPFAEWARTDPDKEPDNKTDKKWLGRNDPFSNYRAGFEWLRSRHAPPKGGIVEARRFGGPDEPRPTLVLANRSDIDLDQQVTAPGATWLGHRLVERESMPLATGGVGQEARDAIAARAEHLVAEAPARR